MEDNAPAEQVQTVGEQNLWVAILVSRIKSALTTDDDLGYNPQSPRPTRIERDCDRWMIESLHPAFVEECDFAGIDAEAVRERVVTGRVQRKALEYWHDSFLASRGRQRSYENRREAAV